MTVSLAGYVTSEKIASSQAEMAVTSLGFMCVGTTEPSDKVVTCDINSSRNNQSFSILPLFSLLSRLQECNPPSPCDQVRPWAAPQGPCGH